MFNNGGHEHVIRNNVFADSADFAIWPYWEKRPNTFRQNIVYLTQGALFVSHAEGSLHQRLQAHESLGTWDDNLYWDTRGAAQLRFFQKTFRPWQALGLDEHSEIADPRFVDARRRDFRLRRGSPAFQLGFRPIDLRRVGLYGDRAWVNEARHANCAVLALPAPARR